MVDSVYVLSSWLFIDKAVTHRLKKVLCCKYSQHVSANVNYLIVENNS